MISASLLHCGGSLAVDTFAANAQPGCCFSAGQMLHALMAMWSCQACDWHLSHLCMGLLAAREAHRLEIAPGGAILFVDVGDGVLHGVPGGSNHVIGGQVHCTAVPVRDWPRH